MNAAGYECGFDGTTRWRDDLTKYRDTVTLEKIRQTMTGEVFVQQWLNKCVAAAAAAGYFKMF